MFGVCRFGFRSRNLSLILLQRVERGRWSLHLLVVEGVCLQSDLGAPERRIGEGRDTGREMGGGRSDIGIV